MSALIAPGMSPRLKATFPSMILCVRLRLGLQFGAESGRQLLGFGHFPGFD